MSEYQICWLTQNITNSSCHPLAPAVKGHRPVTNRFRSNSYDLRSIEAGCYLTVVSPWYIVSSALFAQLLQHIQASCQMVPMARCSPERVTVFQLSTYLSRWSFTDLGEHISRLSREGILSETLSHYRADLTWTKLCWLGFHGKRIIYMPSKQSSSAVQKSIKDKKKKKAHRHNRRQPSTLKCCCMTSFSSLHLRNVSHSMLILGP